MKIAEVAVQITKVFAVELNDNATLEDAEKQAYDEVSSMGQIVDVLDSEIATNDIEADRIKRHSDELLSL